MSELKSSKDISRAELVAEIARRRPWYQRIDFPMHGVSTTDDPDNALIDDAWDNKLGGLTLRDAAIMRPRPKWREIQANLPDMKGLDVLEIGSSCGFFSFEFARRGARKVVGLDVSPQSVSNARWAASALGLENVEFIPVDFVNYSAGDRVDPTGLLSDDISAIPLPDNRFDVAFASTVVDHFFFPLLGLYKMMRLARRYVIIDTPVHPELHGPQPMTLSIAEDRSHHGFQASAGFWSLYVQRLGIPADDISQHIYNDGRGMCMVIDVSNRARALWGA